MANASGTKWNGCCQRYEKYTSSSGGDGGGRASLPFEYAVWRMEEDKRRNFLFTSHPASTPRSFSLPFSDVFFQLSRCHFVIGKIVFRPAACAHEDDTICLFGRRLRYLSAMSILQSSLPSVRLSHTLSIFLSVSAFISMSLFGSCGQSHIECLVST